DAETQTDAGSQVATLLLAASLSTSVDAVKGMTRQRLLEHLIAPLRTANEFADAFGHLVREAWYLHRDQSDAFYFSNTENLTKRLATEAERAPQNKVDQEMRRRLDGIFAPERKAAYQDLKALPIIDEVNLKGPRVLLVLSPDTREPPVEAQRYFDAVTEKNNLCILTGDGSDISSLEEKTRVLYAINKVKAELPESAPQQKDLDDKLEAAEQDFNATVTATFNRIYYPTKGGLQPTKLAMTFTGNHFKGETQIEETLASIGVSKLVLDVEGESRIHIQRAQEVLWPPGQKRVPWRDIKARSIANPRWIWLPQNGLEQLKKIAEQQGRWRDCGDGYEEQGPFEAPKTSVSITQHAYDDQTGQAILEVAPLHSGPTGQIHYATKAEVTQKSHRIMDAQFRTTEVKVWFRAFDPTGERIAGDPVPWTNTLTITHQVRGTGAKRTVELKVVPGGRVRYTLTGANPAEGTPYTAPFEIDGRETTVFCLAEADGVTVQRQFMVPATGDKEVRVDPAKPAVLRRRLEAEGTSDVFALVGHAGATRARLRGARIEVGTGGKTATLRFGNDAAVTPEAVDGLVKAMRAAIGDEMAEVQLAVASTDFSNGHDLGEFVTARGIGLDANEVEQ
ncbi:MAG: chitobiase/beta-hexosaminidase C-terminal domain-containing protein, partial [Myxococcales bacterium]